MTIYKWSKQRKAVSKFSTKHHDSLLQKYGSRQSLTHFCKTVVGVMMTFMNWNAPPFWGFRALFLRIPFRLFIHLLELQNFNASSERVFLTMAFNDLAIVFFRRRTKSEASTMFILCGTMCDKQRKQCNTVCTKIRQDCPPLHAEGSPNPCCFMLFLSWRFQVQDSPSGRQSYLATDCSRGSRYLPGLPWS